SPATHLLFPPTSRDTLARHSFPTRRSSDLPTRPGDRRPREAVSRTVRGLLAALCGRPRGNRPGNRVHCLGPVQTLQRAAQTLDRSEEHTSELQSLRHLVCRLLLEKKKRLLF